MKRCVNQSLKQMFYFLIVICMIAVILPGAAVASEETKVQKVVTGFSDYDCYLREPWAEQPLLENSINFPEKISAVLDSGEIVDIPADWALVSDDGSRKEYAVILPEQYELSDTLAGDIELGLARLPYILLLKSETLAEETKLPAEESESFISTPESFSEETSVQQESKKAYKIAIGSNLSGVRLSLSSHSSMDVPEGDRVTVLADASSLSQGMVFMGVYVVASDEHRIEAAYDASAHGYTFIMPDRDVIIRPAISWPSPMSANALGTSHTITNYGEHMNQGLLRVGYFEIDGGTLAWCTQHSLAPPALGSVLTTAQVWEDNGTWLSTMMRRIAYYGYSGPMAETTKAQLALSDSDLWRYTALAFSYAYGADDNYYGYGQRFVSWLSDMGDAANAPTGLEVYRLASGSSASQDLVYWTYSPEQILRLKKVSAMPDITGGNLCYSLEGARYGVYTDEQCTRQIGTLTTDAQGNSNELMVVPGTYFIRETKASPGFLLSETVERAVVESSPVTITVEEIPILDTMGLTLEKIDAQTGEGAAQGGASLEGAQFTVRYYAGYYEKEGLPEQSTRTWVLESKATEDGAGGRIYGCHLSEAYKVSGDILFYNGKDTVLPLGTITIEETKAPKGYTLENYYFYPSGSTEKMTGLYIAQIKEDGAKAQLEGGHFYTFADYPGRGGIEIHKVDKDTMGAGAQGDGSLEDAVYGIFSRNKGSIIVDGVSYKKGDEVLRLTTDEDGRAKTAMDVLPFGDYELREVEASKGYLLDKSVYGFSVSKDKTIIALDRALQESVIRGGVKLSKRDEDTRKNTSQGKASLEGAVFCVVNTSTHSVFVDGVLYPSGETVVQLVTDKQGFAQTSADLLPFGSYKIVESEAPEGYLKDETACIEFKITENGKLVDLTGEETSIYNRIIRGGVKIQKRDIESGLATPQGGATLKGAVFEIINMNAQSIYVNQKLVLPGKTAAKLVTDDRGLAVSEGDLLPYGTYKLVEVSAPEGYLTQGTTELIFSVTDDGAVVDLTDAEHSVKNQIIRGGVRVQKRDIQSGDSTAQGDASLLGAVFEIINMSSHSVMVNQKAYGPREAICRITTDESGLAATEKDLLPYGQYKIVEMTPPRGYLGEGVTELEFSVREEGKTVDLTSPEQSVKNRVIRGDFELTKINAETQNAMADVLFKITSNTTGESHNFTTDANGFYSSASGWNAHSHNTNGGGAGDGLWFGLDGSGGSLSVDDRMGALPFDTYTIEELRCPANEGKRLYKGTVSISREGYTVDMGNIENESIQKPGIMTAARCEDTGTAYGPARDNVVLTDTVTYKGLIPGKSYTIKGQLMNKETGAPIMTEDGTAVTAKKHFKCVLSQGSEELSFIVDASGLAGTQVVVFQTLYFDEEPVAEHKDIDDEGQTIYFPSLETKARNKDNGANYADAAGMVTLADTVSYTNLEPGQKYTVTGILMDAGEKRELLINGQEVTASTTFIPKEADGEVEVVFSLMADELMGKTIVVFETLSRGNVIYGEHKDMNDKGQTIYFTGLETTAVDGNSSTHIGLVSDMVTIKDTVYYKNLTPGTEYRLEGVLMDAKTGKALEAGGQTWMVTKDFTPNASEGTAEIEFHIPGDAVAGRVLVVFERVYEGEQLICAHTDINAQSQTVYYPVIATSASGNRPGCQEVFAGKETRLLDTVEYKGLIPGKEYRLSGSLIDPGSGKMICDRQGQPVISELTFTPKQCDGTVTVEFLIDATAFAGKNIVVFESLSLEGTPIAEHKSKEDMQQTIRFPKIHTQAYSVDTGEQISGANDCVTIIDKVFYENLTAGEEYRIKGQVMRKNSGEPLLVDNMPVVCETIFTPKKSSGSVDMEFIFDAKALEGCSIVFFEALLSGDTLMAEHKDLSDHSQTVHFPKIETTATDGRTGTHFGWPFADTVVTVTDAVSYENLIPGKLYHIAGVLMDKASGRPLMWNDAEVTAEQTFTPEEEQGKIILEFHVPGAALAGKTVVAFESMDYNGVEICSHEDIDDDAQSVMYPDIQLQTKARDKVTGTNNGAAADPIVIIDTVSYKDLVAGQEYRIEGILMDKSTGEPFLSEGQEVRSQAVFKPEAPEGSIELSFTFNGARLNHKELVVFETLYWNDAKLAEHEDLENDAQTINILPPDSPVFTAPQTGIRAPRLWIFGGVGLALVTAGIVINSRKKHTDK